MGPIEDDSKKLPGTGAFWLRPGNVHDFVRRAAEPGIGLVALHVFQETHVTEDGNGYLGYRVFLGER